MEIQGIEGLCWEPTTSIENGVDSTVVPFPTTDLVHLVYHGEEPFSHGRYGLHRGLEDHLTFLGPSTTQAQGFFVDCRRDSPTLHRRITLDFTPSSRRTLKIPCGVAHGFKCLEGVYTLNAFRAYLPPPEHLLTERNPWATGADIYNFSYDTPNADLPIVDPNPYPASPVFYEVLSEMQKATLGTIEYEYPHTEEVVDPDGNVATLMIKKRLSVGQQLLDWEPIEGIDGVGWRKHLLVWAGPAAGYAAFTDVAPIQVIDHGENSYSTDAYGIHLEWEDRLTFVGPSDRTVRIKLLDCRSQSSTQGQELCYEFKPSPLRMLVIPPGVAHAFESLERVFTINRPCRRAGDPESFEPGNDVIDWPLGKRPGPLFDIETREFPFSYYQQLVQLQKDYLALRKDNLSTPAVLLVDDGSGRQVRVAIRQNVRDAS
ncbi:dTDP-4-dehydrorhamnose 3,5-epimerase family protein [Methylocystis sp.]|uniref:dTDP-4-dehydrorhamnose 3,5-epimerase family protein n=1 Tax=Methylocystis sp. TaxID=1911079 RepID=UPI0025DAC183|nr:dTDP-4-dehydrorhamnose 3,5-epimerase family protein [Methylocystis sp.]